MVVPPTLLTEAVCFSRFAAGFMLSVGRLGRVLLGQLRSCKRRRHDVQHFAVSQPSMSAENGTE